jgi:hypothetical protein
MTPQEIFDRVATHLFTQGKQAVDGVNGPGGGYCQYRASDGSRCAVGALLPDALYNEDMEGQNVGGLYQAYPEVRAYFGEANYGLLISLQGVHDHPDNWETEDYLKTRLARVAEHHDLDSSILSTLHFPQAGHA